MNNNRERKSLLDGRNVAPLTEHEIRRATNTFMGMDNRVVVRFQEASTTRFRQDVSEDGEEYGEIIFSNDVYPGRNIANPNSALSLKGAAAHELAHYYRWEGKTELPHGTMTHIDEAMTSLEAALRFSQHLDATDIQGLISDSLQRLTLFLNEQAAEEPAVADEPAAE